MDSPISIKFDGATSVMSPCCSLCSTTCELDDLYHRSVGICRDCKFLLLNDPENSDILRAAASGNNPAGPLFSRELLQLISKLDYTSPAGPSDGSALVDPRTNSTTTPIGSSRWRRFYSDNESDGFGNVDSIFAESEQNFGSSVYRFSVGDFDAISLGTFEIDSDDAHSAFDPEFFQPADDYTTLYSDAGIDPMRAGIPRWDSDNIEDDDVGWVEPDLDDKDSVIAAENNGGASSHSRTISYIFTSEIHDGLACAVCKDAFELRCELTQLPCLHLYHTPCILPWLRLSNTCPVCRYELPADDIDYIKEKGSFISVREIGSPTIHSHSSTDSESEYGTDLSDEEATDDEDDAYEENNYTTETTQGRWIFTATPIVGFLGFVLALFLRNRSRDCTGDKRR